MESIFVIDDSPEIQELVKFILEQRGYSVSSALLGQEALTVLKTHPDFALILLDYTLPDMTALEFLLNLKKEDPSASSPIVLFSAISDLAQVEVPPNVVGTLRKPFQIQDLVKTVETYKLKSIS